MLIGDIIVVSGNTFISKAIQKVVGSKWTHVAMYVGAGRVLEIDWNTRAQITPNVYLEGDLECVILRSAQPLSKEQRKQIISLAIAYDNTGAKYDWLRLVSMFIQKKMPAIKLLPFHSKNDFVCTELTADIMSQIGIELFPDFVGNVYPHDFLQTEQLKMVTSVLQRTTNPKGVLA